MFKFADKKVKRQRDGFVSLFKKHQNQRNKHSDPQVQKSEFGMIYSGNAVIAVQEKGKLLSKKDKENIKKISRKYDHQPPIFWKKYFKHGNADKAYKETKNIIDANFKRM